jgi:periplasmic protein TonB
MSGRLPISAFCVWEIPDRGIAVHMHLSAVEWLDYEIRESLRAPEAAEVGGLLLGRTDSKAWNKITIEGFTPVSCKHEAGSLYHLSNSDKDLLKEQLSRWQRGPGKNLYVVGFYRSHNREDFSLDAEDLSLAKEYFSDSTGVFLLVKPVGQRDRVGGLFLCDEGHVERECNLIFPFNRSRLTRGETTLASLPEREEQDMPEGAAAPYLAPEEREFEPEAFTRKPSPRRGHLPAEEREFEPAAYAPSPTPRPGQLTEEKEFQPEAFTPTPSPRRGHLPLEEKELERGKLSHGADHAELEFVSGGPPAFAAIESETPRWRSWAGMPAAAILILVASALSYQLLQGSGIPRSLAGLFSSLVREGGQLLRKPAVPRPQNSGALGLKVELEGEFLRVSWDRDSPSIVTANRGSLSISDGDSTREVPLEADELRTGSIRLRHATSQVAVRFQVIGAKGEAGEMARAIRIDRAAVAPSSDPVTESRDRIPTINIEPPPPSRARGSGTRAQTQSSSRNRKPEAAKPSELVRAQPTLPRTSSATSASSTLSPPPVSGPAPLEQKPAEAGAQRDEPQRSRTVTPEQVKSVPPPTESAPAPFQSETTQRPPVAPPPKVTEPAPQPDSVRTAQEQPPVSTSREPAKSVVLPEKTPASPAGAPPSAQPLSAPVTRSDYVPARPVRQVKPATPSNVRKLISEDVQINVRVEIDATGRVVRAEPVSTKQDYLTSLALEAARQWRFSPARQGTRNVSSSAVVGFQFKKD